MTAIHFVEADSSGSLANQEGVARLVNGTVGYMNGWVNEKHLSVKAQPPTTITEQMGLAVQETDRMAFGKVGRS